MTDHEQEAKFIETFWKLRSTLPEKSPRWPGVVAGVLTMGVLTLFWYWVLN